MKFIDFDPVSKDCLFEVPYSEVCRLSMALCEYSHYLEMKLETISEVCVEDVKAQIDVVEELRATLEEAFVEVYTK